MAADRRPSKPPGEGVIPGRRAVVEALHAGRPIRKILLARTAHGPTVRDIVQQAKGRGVVVQAVDPRRLEDLARGIHQGVVALTAAAPAASIDDILAVARARDQAPLVLVLDGVLDPANLGALIRTADGAGVHGVIIPRHRAAGVTPAVVRASAGAVEHMPVAVVANIVRTLVALKAAGLWVVGTDPLARDLYHQVPLLPPLAVVMGGEDRGLGRLVREHCDLVVRLPMRGKLASLNVSVAAGVLLYEVGRQMEAAGSGG